MAERTRNAGSLEQTLRIDIRDLRRRGFLQPGSVTSGMQNWSWSYDGSSAGSASLTVNLSGGDRGALIVRFNQNGLAHVQDIDIVSMFMS